MIDFFNFVTESPVASIDVSSIDSRTDSVIPGDNAFVTLKYENGSVCSLAYTSQGAKELDKEYIEIHADQKTILIQNFRNLIPYGTKYGEIAFSKVNKGHLAGLKQFAKSIKADHGHLPISLESMIETTKVTFKIKECLKSL